MKRKNLLLPLPHTIRIFFQYFPYILSISVLYACQWQMVIHEETSDSGTELLFVKVPDSIPGSSLRISNRVAMKYCIVFTKPRIAVSSYPIPLHV